jgi:hypothetical protein
MALYCVSVVDVFRKELLMYLGFVWSLGQLGREISWSG